MSAPRRLCASFTKYLLVPVALLVTHPNGKCYYGRRGQRPSSMLQGLSGTCPISISGTLANMHRWTDKIQQDYRIPANTNPPVCVSAARLTLCERTLRKSVGLSLLAGVLIERWSKAPTSPRYKREVPIVRVTALHNEAILGITRFFLI